MITWEGKSCNPFQYHNRGPGATIHGTKGTILLDRNSYIAWDMDNKVIKDLKAEEKGDTINTIEAGPLDVKHFNNMPDAIRIGAKLNAPIDESVISNLYCHLGNISQEVGRTLYLNKNTGRIIGDGQAMQMWTREYERGWELKV